MLTRPVSKTVSVQVLHKYVFVLIILDRDEEQIPDYAGLTKPWFGTTANRPPRVVMLTRLGLDGLMEAVIAGGLDIPHETTARALVGATSSLPAEGNRSKVLTEAYT